jgi:hypothetical protein
MSTHANKARDELREAVNRDYSPVRDAAKSFGQQITALREAEDLVEALRIATALAQTAAALGSSANVLATKARGAIAGTMADTGCTSFDLNEQQQAVLVDKERRPVITDRAAIPQRYFVPRDPALDLDLLAADLAAGIAVDGATLSNPEKTISIRARKRARKAA